MRYSETGIKYVENLTDYSRKQIIEMLQGKGNYTKYNQDKVTTLYEECSGYPSGESVEIISRDKLDKIREHLLEKTSLKAVSEELHCLANSPSYFTRLRLDKISYKVSKRIDTYLKEHYQFDLLKECGLPSGYLESYYKKSAEPNEAIKRIADKYDITYKYALRIINRLKTNPSFEPRTDRSKELNKAIEKVAKEEGLL